MRTIWPQTGLDLSFKNIVHTIGYISIFHTIQWSYNKMSYFYMRMFIVRGPWLCPQSRIVQHTLSATAPPACAWYRRSVTAKYQSLYSCLVYIHSNYFGLIFVWKVQNLFFTHFRSELFCHCIQRQNSGENGSYYM